MWDESRCPDQLPSFRSCSIFFNQSSTAYCVRTHTFFLWEHMGRLIYDGKIRGWPFKASFSEFVDLEFAGFAPFIFSSSGCRHVGCVTVSSGWWCTQTSSLFLNTFMAHDNQASFHLKTNACYQYWWQPRFQHTHTPTTVHNYSLLFLETLNIFFHACLRATKSLAPTHEPSKLHQHCLK